MTARERRRVRFLFLLLACVPMFLTGWFSWVQILQAGSLPRPGQKALPLSAGAADQQRDRREPRPSARGTIVDRHGAALALDCDAYEVRAEVRPPRAVRADAAALRRYCADLARRLAAALSRDDSLADRAAAYDAHLRRLAQRLFAAFGLDADVAPGRPEPPPTHKEILVATDVAVLAVVEALQALDDELDSVLLHLRHDHVRVHPEREATWGLVGYIEDEAVRDAEGRLRGYVPRAPVGLEAIAKLEPGAPGLRSYRVDSRHQRFYAGVGMAPAPASCVETTLDLELQKAAQRELDQTARGVGKNGARLPLWGALVLVEVATGDVLAAASWHRDVEHARGAAFAPYQLLYEPGSVVKPLVFALAMQRCGLDWNDIIDCSSSGSEHQARVAEANGRLVRDDHPCGRLTPHEVLVNSSNIGAVKVGSRLEREDWRQWLDLFGFGHTLDLPLPQERVGGGNKKGWRAGIAAGDFKKWTGSSYAFGYELQVNALQVARAFLTLLHGGQRPLRLVRALEVDGVRQEAQIPPVERVFDPAVVQAVQAAMTDVISDTEGATGRHLVDAFRKQEPPVELHGLMAGKTGTAKSRTTVNGKTVEVRNASFVGFLPASAPRWLAVCVLQKDDSARFYGGSYAAPPATRLLLEALRLDDRRRLRQEPQVSATPGDTGRHPRVPETRQAGR